MSEYAQTRAGRPCHMLAALAMFLIEKCPRSRPTRLCRRLIVGSFFPNASALSPVPPLGRYPAPVRERYFRSPAFDVQERTFRVSGRTRAEYHSRPPAPTALSSTARGQPDRYKSG
jgi:hypothetical protein